MTGADGDGTRTLGGLSRDTIVNQDAVLVGLTTIPPRVDRQALYSLSPWRAVMLARIAHGMQVMPRAERDGLVREAQHVGSTGTVKAWADRTPRERTHGVRAGTVTDR